jgi:hypothetical protein
MPVTNPELRLKLRRLGIDPDTAEDVVTEQPSNNPTPQVMQPNGGPSALGAGGRESLRSLPATGAALAAFPYGAKAGAAVGSFFGPGPGTAIGGAVGGIGASVLTGLLARMGQDAILDKVAPSYTESMQADATQQPVASAIGGLASGLVGMKPDPKALVGAGRALRDIALQKTIHPATRVAAADAGNLANVGLGAAVPVGVEYGQQAYAQGTALPEMDWRVAAINALGGGVISNPNKIGRKLGLTPNTYREYATDGLAEAQPNSPKLQQLPPSEADLQYQNELQATPEYQAFQAKQAEVEAKKQFLEQWKALKTQEFEANKQIEAELSVEQMDKARLAQRGQYEQQLNTDQQARAVRQQDFIPAKVEELRATDLVAKPSIEARPKPAATTELGKEIYPDYTGNQEIDATINEKIPLDEAEVIQDEYDRGIRKSKESDPTKSPIIYKNYFDAGNGKKLHIWDLTEDVVDSKGNVIHPKGSTVSEPTLQRLGIPYEIPADKKSKQSVFEPRQLGRRASNYESKKPEKVGNYIIDNVDGAGAVPYNQEVNYRGFVKYMKPKDFLDVNPSKTIDTTKEISNSYQKRIGAPYLNVDWDEAAKVWKIIGHEGRNRASLLFREQPDLDVPIHIFPRNHRARDLTPEMLDAPFVADKDVAKYGDKTRYQEASPLDNKPSEASVAAMDKLAASRGVRIVRPNEVIADGESVAGITDINTREAQISRTKGGLDTDPHEIEHNFGPDLLKRGTKGEQELQAKSLQMVKDSPDFKQWREEGEYKELSEDLAVEEFLTTETGIDFVRRVYKTDGKGDFKNFLSDVKSMIRERKGKADYTDMVKLKSRKLAYDPPASETFDRVTGQNVGAASDTTETTTAPESSIKKSKDSGQDRKTETSKQSRIGSILKSDIDKVKELGETGKVFGDTAEQFLETRTENIGKFTTPLIRELRSAVPHSRKPAEFAKEIWSNDNPTFQRVVQYFDDLHDGKTPAKLGSAEQRVADIWRKYSELVYNERAKRGELHQGEKNTNYLPQTVNKDTIDRFKNPAEHKKLQSELTSYYKSLGRSADEAKENFDAIIAGYSKQEVNTAEQFGPLDKAHGIGLPKNWREASLLSRVAKYMDRSGRRFAYYDTFDQLENKKEVLDSVKVNDNAKAILREIHGTSAFHEPEINAITGLVKSFMLGPLTGSVDLVNSHTLGMQHQQNPAQTVKAWWNSWKNVKQGWKDSYQMGRNRINFNALEWDEASDITDSIRRVRDIVGEIGGRNILEKITRARVMAEGRFLATDYLNQQAKGSLSKQGHKFFNDFGKNIDWKSGKLDNEEILKLAARYVDSVQGTYDPRGTDFRVREGALGPYLSLSRWSIEKLNNYNKHVIGAAAEGNWTPLLMSTLGMFIGGSAVNYLRETITKRKQKTAEWKELAAAKAEGEDIKADVLYKLAGLASASAYAGMLGDITKAVMDTAYGKNKAQTPNNVLIEAADNLVSTIASGFKGAADNGITPELFIDVVAKALEDNVQAYRVALAHLSDAKGEDIERQNKQRDLRTYNTIAGNPITDLTGEFITPMGNRDAKKFKKTDDIGEAAELVPSLIEDAIKKAKGNPDLLKKNLTALKQNSYQTMPNPETMPTTFLSYITYLEKSQGSQAATKRLQDYLERNAINKAKASMIP